MNEKANSIACARNTCTTGTFTSCTASVATPCIITVCMFNVDAPTGKPYVESTSGTGCTTDTCKSASDATKTSCVKEGTLCCKFFHFSCPAIITCMYLSRC